jgi:HTH-type transcriptional regulator / antitoxin HigA
MKRPAHSSRPPRSFQQLTALWSLRPIRTESDLAKAEQISDRLAVLDERTSDQDDYLETLSLLIERYEDHHHAIEVAYLNPIELLHSLMTSRDMSASELGRLLGNRSLGPALLRGDRELSKANILALCRHFAVGPELFLNPARPARRAS